MSDGYTEAYGFESYGQYGMLGVKVMVGGLGRELTGKEKTVIADATNNINSVIMEERIRRDPGAQQRAEEQRRGLLECFPEIPVYVEEIPNGYCHDYCCRHLPWFKVTTPKGIVTIGWRKRVINIDWSLMRNPSAMQLFSQEDVTKGEYLIHAWSYEKAKEYLAKILA